MTQVSYVIVNIIDKLLGVYSIIIIADVLLSWFVPPTHSLKQFLDFLVAPVLRPIRKLMQPLMAKSSLPIDFSPIIAMLAISLLRQLLKILWASIF